MVIVIYQGNTITAKNRIIENKQEDIRLLREEAAEKENVIEANKRVINAQESNIQSLKKIVELKDATILILESKSAIKLQ